MAMTLLAFRVDRSQNSGHPEDCQALKEQSVRPSGFLPTALHQQPRHVSPTGEERSGQRERKTGFRIAGMVASVGALPDNPSIPQFRLVTDSNPIPSIGVFLPSHSLARFSGDSGIVVHSNPSQETI
jgi:hypothetical protein